MRHPSDWPADKETFSDDEMYFIVYAKHNHVPPWRSSLFFPAEATLDDAMRKGGQE